MEKNGAQKIGHKSVALYASLVALVLFVALCWAGLRLYLATDDFIFIQRIMEEGFPGALSPFMEGRTLWRPLSQETYFYLMHSLFDLWATPYHIVNLVLMAANIVLVGLVTKRLTGWNEAAVLAGSMYAVSFLNFRLFLWVSCIQDILMIFFALLAVLCFLRAERLLRFTGSAGFARWAAPLFFVLSVLSKESGIWLPVWLVFLDLVLFTKEWRHDLRSRVLLHLPLLALMAAFFIFRLFVIPTPTEGLYRVDYFGIHILELAHEYGNDYLAASGIALPLGGTPPWYLTAALVPALCGLILLLAAKAGKFRPVLAGLVFTGLGTSMFLFLPERNFEYYLSLASIGLYLGLAVALVSLWRTLFPVVGRVAAAIFLLYFFAYSAHLHLASFHGHWVVNLANFTKELHHVMKKRYPEVPTGKKVIVGAGFETMGDPAIFGIKALYDDPDLTVYSMRQAFNVKDTKRGYELLPRPGFDYSDTIMFVYDLKQGPVEYLVSPDGEEIEPIQRR